MTGYDWHVLRDIPTPHGSGKRMAHTIGYTVVRIKMILK